VSGSALPIPNDYATSTITPIGEGGSIYSYDDGVSSTACVDANYFCGAGNDGIADSLGTVWGGGIGILLNTANSATAPQNPYPVPSTSSGVAYVLDTFYSGMRMVTDVSGSQYCAVLSSSNGVVLWSDFNTKCWDPLNGSNLVGPPTVSHYVQFEVPASSLGTISYNFCVELLYYY
jgi:hypothetical protein